MTRAGSTEGVPPTQAQLRAYRRRVSPPDNEVPSIMAVQQVLSHDRGVAVSLLGAQVFSRGLSLEVVVQFQEPPTTEQQLALQEMRKPGADARGWTYVCATPTAGRRGSSRVTGHQSAKQGCRTSIGCC